MTPRMLTLTLAAAAFAGAATLPSGRVEARQMPAAPVYAIRGAKIVTAGSTIDKGNVVMRNGLIEDVGANAAVPDDAVAMDGTGLTVYPGLIDMTNTAAAGGASAADGGRGDGQGAAGGATALTWADGDRAKREALLNADVEAARTARYDGVQMQRFASAGITSVLAVPASGLFKGQSALINVMAPPDQNDVSRVGADRRGAVVIKTPVAQHVTFTGRGGGAGYPQALLGDIAFVRQTFYDAQWQKDARAWAAKHAGEPRPEFERVLDALVPALEGRMPVSFDAAELREILRALAMAKEFRLDPIITGGIEASEAIADLKAANAKVILTLNTAAGGGGRGGGRGGAADVPIRVTRMQQNAPKVPAALEKAGIPYAFSSEGLQTAGDFLRGVARAVRDGGLTPDQALRALTVNAAKMAGASDRLGTLEKGKIANVIVLDGDLFSDASHMRRVFVDGRPVNIDAVPAAPAPGGRRGGGAK